MGIINLRDLRTLLEYQEKIDASVERGIALINCGGSAQDAFDNLHKAISELAGVPAAIRESAVVKIHNAKMNKARIDAENVARAVMAAEIEALLNHRKNINSHT